MRTTIPIMIVLSLAVAGAMIGGSGFEQAWGAPAPETDAAESELADQSDDLKPGNPAVEGPVTQNDDSIIGLVVDSLSTITSVAGMVAVLPATLINLGFPAWFALPIGSVVYIITGVGVLQFATSRSWS